MYLNETDDPQTKADLALIIEETIKQRMQGVKNEQGVWITPAFPKLIYVLEEDNIYPDSKYYYLTELAAKCTAKRLVPDYISEKKMKEYKEGNCFPVMGCVDKDEVVTYKLYDKIYTESISRMWNRVNDTTTEKYKRFLQESDYMYNKWKYEIENDKFYNDNFTKKYWFYLDK